MNLSDHFAANERVNYHIVEKSGSESTGTVATNNNNNLNNANANAANADGNVVTTTVPGARTGHIKQEYDFRFYLYRHWSLYESMFHSVCMASKFTIWNKSGKDKVEGLLATMGVPKAAAQQTFQSMTPATREQFRSQLLNNESIPQQYQLKPADVMMKVSSVSVLLQCYVI